MSKVEGLIVFYDWRTVFKQLSGKEARKLLLAMMDYKQYGIEPPEFTERTQAYADIIFSALERSMLCAEKGKKGAMVTNSKRSSAGSSADSSADSPADSSAATLDKTRQNNTRQDNTREYTAPPEAHKAPRTRHPSLEQVREYCAERNSGISAEAFFDFYTANGWTQGHGKPIRDWKAAVRTWERRNEEYSKKNLRPVDEYTPPTLPPDLPF